MDNFFAELKRRHIYRVAAAYVVVAWLLLQVVNNVAPFMRLPDWAGGFFLVALLVGFPVALLFAWIGELKAPESAVAQRATAGPLDWALMAALVVVIALVSYQQLASSPPTRTQEAGVNAARAASATLTSAISVAVLPFTNLSSDPEQAFFSDGMTEEITAALAKISDLRVVARTSAFQFKGENKDMRAVGQALGATHLIEGSVRKAGTRVRITAQLIKSDDGTHIWSENYDRELTDVFAIQEDIATAIAGALRMPLGLKPGERLVTSRTIDAESYQQYLRAKQLVRARRSGVPQAIKILEPLVERNPDYAPAWAQLAHSYNLTAQYSRISSVDELRRAVDTFLPKSEAAALRAIKLDPNLADGYMALALTQAHRGKVLLVEDSFSKALALDPNNPAVLSGYSNMLANVGRLKEALAMKQQMRALEPYLPGYIYDTAEILWLNGQDDAAIAMLKEVPSDFTALVDLARIYAAIGRYNEAADILLEIPSRVRGFPPEVMVEPARLLRTAPVVSASPQKVEVWGALGFIFLYVGNPNGALAAYEHAVDGGLFAAGGSDDAFLWHPSYAAVRKTDRYKAFIRKSGYVDYWRAKGWPDLCRPTTGDDFECN